MMHHQYHSHQGKVLGHMYKDYELVSQSQKSMSLTMSQWDKGGKGLVLTSPSLNKKRAADGISIGDDICK